MDRRQFLQYSTAAAATLALPTQWVQAKPKADVKRWQGFNLLNYFSHWGPFPFREEEFKWISDWGFNYVRIPLSYWCWTKPGGVPAERFSPLRSPLLSGQLCPPATPA